MDFLFCPDISVPDLIILQKNVFRQLNSSWFPSSVSVHAYNYYKCVDICCEFVDTRISYEFMNIVCLLLPTDVSASVNFRFMEAIRLFVYK